MQRTSDVPLLATVLGAAVVATSCAAPQVQPAAANGTTTIEGTIASIDLQPWTYDGHAMIQVDVPNQGRVAVQLPARWNLCKAQPVDVETLKVGVKVQAVGETKGAGALMVCTGAEDRVVPL
ncbi:hypothetical protein [Pseudoxanthomonas suwonensis]|uniref:hypothetical protein n=1 Tax=Pseudoxanthomonas suwonensis TaxID=314722 RepID=UPI0006888310|nr:hypothetical protein [Pseudoxanthomonas suwonensis]